MPTIIYDVYNYVYLNPDHTKKLAEWQKDIVKSNMVFFLADIPFNLT